MPGSGNINDSVNENSEEEGLFEDEGMKQSEQRSVSIYQENIIFVKFEFYLKTHFPKISKFYSFIQKPSKERQEMIKRKIEMYLDKIIEISEERSDSIMFLLYLAGVDKSKIIFNHLKSKIRKILSVLK